MFLFCSSLRQQCRVGRYSRLKSIVGKLAGLVLTSIAEEAGTACLSCRYIRERNHREPASMSIIIGTYVLSIVVGQHDSVELTAGDKCAVQYDALLKGQKVICL